MRTVKEVSNLTGISVRTLHYYDEIGLLKPASVSEAGYRLYDDKSLETLQQILFLWELDLPLKQIRLMLENPDTDNIQLLNSQKKMLELKKERLERMIASIEEILRGDNKMDFEVFNKNELEQLYQMDNVSQLMLDIADKYVNNKEMQKNLDKVYGLGSTYFIGQTLGAFYGKAV